MGFRLPTIKLPDLAGFADIQLPSINLPKINMPELPGDTSGLTDKLDEVSQYVDFNKMGETARNMPPVMDFVTGKININEVADKLTVGSACDSLGVDLNGLTNKLTSGMNLPGGMQDPTSMLSGMDMSMLTSPDLSQINSALSMPEMQGLENFDMSEYNLDPSSIASEIDLSELQNMSFSGSNITAQIADMKVADLIGSNIIGGKEIPSIKDIKTYFESKGIDGIKNDAFKLIQDRINEEIEDAKNFIDNVKEFASYIDASGLDFSSFDAMLHNDYKSVALNAVIDFANAKLGPMGISVSSNGIDFNMDKMMSGMGIDMSSFQDISLDDSILGDFSEFENFDLGDGYANSMDISQFENELNTDSLMKEMEF